MEGKCGVVHIYRKGENGRSHIKGICVRTTGFVWWVESKGREESACEQRAGPDGGGSCVLAAVQGTLNMLWDGLTSGHHHVPMPPSQSHGSPIPQNYATSRPNVKPTLPTKH